MALAWRNNSSTTQQVAVAQHDLQRRDLGIGAQDIEPVQAGIFGDPGLVDGEMLGREGLQITRKPLLPTRALSP
jgi:hypothetical protein